MSAISVILLAIIFCVIQITLLKKGNKKWLKFLPAAIGGVGVVIGIVIYYISYILLLLEMQSQSVLSENQYFALTICILFIPCLVGSLLGIVMTKFLGKKQLFYFLPFIFFIIVYMGAVVMGLGMIARYFLEYGEVSNTYNFTLKNIVIHIVIMMLLSMMFWMQTKKKAE